MKFDVCRSRITACIMIVLLTFVGTVVAETNELQILGRLEGNGTHFELNNSEYLNITLDSSEPIKLVLESIPETVTMYFEPLSGATSTQITLSGFVPETTYHKYEDDYHNHTVFMTDSNGNYTYIQNLSMEHLVFIQPRASTKFIRDDATGGNCNLIGTWDLITKTCTLTTDLTETIQIDSNSITLDGNGHTIKGSNTGSGVYLYGIRDVKIKNLNIKDFSRGICLYYSSNSTLNGNKVNSDFDGIYLYYSTNNTLSGNNASFNNRHGIYMDYISRNNTLSGNNASFNKRYGIYLNLFASGYNILSDNNASNNGIGIFVGGDSPWSNSGAYTLSDNNASNNEIGILLQYTNHNTLSSNDANSNNGYGIYLYASKYNILSGNNANYNNYYGINLAGSSYNILSGNNASFNNRYGIYLYYSFTNDNTLSRNNLVNNNDNAYDKNVNNWDNGAEGNYYSDYTGIDSNGDGIGDTPYPIPGGSNMDRYPLMAPYSPAPPIASITITSPNGGENWQAGSIQNIQWSYTGDPGSEVKIEILKGGEVVQTYDSIPMGDIGIGSYPWTIPRTQILGNDYQVRITSTTNSAFMDTSGNFDINVGYAIIVAGNDQGTYWPPKVSQKFAMDHSANNVYRVLRNLGFDNNHIFYLNDVSQQIDGQNVVDKSASIDNLQNSLEEIKQKIGDSPTPLILYYVGHGHKEGLAFYNSGDEVLISSDLRNMLEPFHDEPMLIVIGSCYSGSFITTYLPPSGTDTLSGDNRIIITASHDDEETPWSILGLGSWYHSSDRFWGNLNNGLNVRDALVTDAWPIDFNHLWIDDNGDKIGHSPDALGDDGMLAEATRIGVVGVNNLELIPWVEVWIHSPGEVRVYDSQNRVTGLVNGEILEEIPSSIYDADNKIVAIFSMYDTYRYEVMGTDTGTYGLDIATFKGKEITMFNAIDIPTTSGQIHQYTIDWDALSKGEKGVTMQIDTEGDGIIDRTIQVGTVLTDITPPQITINVPSNGGEYILNQNILADWSAIDLESGVASKTGTKPSGEAIETTTIGSKTFTVDAIDNAGNSATKAVSYNVIYNFNGFLQPIDNLPSWNSVKAGSAVPVKFSLSGDQGLDIFVTNYPASQKIDCDSNAPISIIEETVTAGSSSISYNATIDQYNYVWKTDKAWAGSCRQLVVMLNDGTYHNANFKFLK